MLSSSTCKLCDALVCFLCAGLNEQGGVLYSRCKLIIDVHGLGSVLPGLKPLLNCTLIYQDDNYDLQFLSGQWGILFSHPNDYTPVCTTELGEAALRQADFDSRGVKLIGLSCNSAEDHDGWCADIKALRGAAVRLGLSFECSSELFHDLKFLRSALQPDFPIIADPKREIAALLGMLDEVNIRTKECCLYFDMPPF